MDSNIAGTFIVAVVFYFFYKIVEVIARRKERIIKAENGESENNQNNFYLNTKDLDTDKWSYLQTVNKITKSALLIGIGLGVIIGICISIVLFSMEGIQAQDFTEIKGSYLIILACAIFFGGLGLLIGTLYVKKEKNSHKA